VRNDNFVQRRGGEEVIVVDVSDEREVENLTKNENKVMTYEIDFY
tara:strand:- start:165 stop:299 length:135 start_codon:yes stop_codon:yes gene_type:complete